MNSWIIETVQKNNDNKHRFGISNKTNVAFEDGFIYISVLFLCIICILLLLNCSYSIFSKCKANYNRKKMFEKLYEGVYEDDIGMDTTCAICLEENNENSIVLKCHHEFHKSCIHRWIEEKTNNVLNVQVKCPVCNNIIYE